jgi:hypothetical protein
VWIISLWVSPQRFQMAITNIDKNITVVSRYFFLQDLPSYTNTVFIAMIVMQHTIKQNNHQEFLGFFIDMLSCNTQQNKITTNNCWAIFLPWLFCWIENKDKSICCVLKYQEHHNYIETLRILNCIYLCLYLLKDYHNLL